jgi:hypothetical protein
MQDERHAPRGAARERDAARARVRRVTGIVLAASVAVAASLAGYVSSAASGRKPVRRATTTRATPQKTRRTAQVPVPATPAAPSLIPSGSSPSQSGSTQASAPAQAPVQTQAPAVAVSGGS